MPLEKRDINHKDETGTDKVCFIKYPATFLIST